MNRIAFTRVGLALGVATFALVAMPAEARFGKRSETAQSSKDSGGDGNDSRSTPPRKASRPRRSHDASAVGAPRRYVEERHVHRHWAHCGHPGYAHILVAPSVGYYGHYHYYDAPTYVAPPTVYAPPPERSNPFEVKRFEFTGSAQPMLNGGMLGAQLRVDWQSLGLDLRYDYLALLAEDGSFSFDTIKLFDMAGTFALVDGEHGRLRAHLGAYMAFAPDVIFVGPGGGLSASVKLVGPMTADAGAQLVLIPFTKVDTWAGAGVRFGAVEGRAGMRFTLLDDQGRVDGVRNTDVMVGPFVSLSLVL